MRSGWFAALLLAVSSVSARAEEASYLAVPLDQCSVIVTGTDMRSRPDGLSRCLAQVLAKVSGDPSVGDDPKFAAIGAKAGELVEDFAYFDRMSDQPMHDEQGSRDRPFNLVVHFDPPKVDAALADLGRKPWRGIRPTLAVVISITDQRDGHYPLAADTLDGERQREALYAAGQRFGLRIALFPLAAMPRADATGVEIEDAARRVIQSAPLAALSGSLVWTPKEYGWTGTWRMQHDGASKSWTIKGVSFDEAFRNAVGGAGAVLSGSAR